jgi:hypothetical protein
VLNPVGLPWYYCVKNVPLLLYCVMLLYYLRGPSNLSSPTFSSTTFQNSPGTSDLVSEESNFPHHTKLCSKCITSLMSSLALSLTSIECRGEECGDPRCGLHFVFLAQNSSQNGDGYLIISKSHFRYYATDFSLFAATVVRRIQLWLE